MKMIKVGLIGLEHVHGADLVRQFRKYPDRAEVIGVADVEENTADELEYKLSHNVYDARDIKLWDNYKELLANIDVALIGTDVADHADIACEVLAAGVNAVVEKPMALSMADAKRMYRAYHTSDAELIINWPIAWFPSFRKVKELADSGAVGKVLRVQYRSPATTGPYDVNTEKVSDLEKTWWYHSDRGGGSICDYACYGCVLTTWITNKIAKRVSGMKKNFFLPFSDAEDYSTFTIDFGDSVGFLEGSWSTLNSGEIATGPVVYGSKGTLVADRYSNEVKVYTTVPRYKPSPAPDEVFAAEPIEDNIGLNVLDFLQKGKPLYELVTAEFNMKAMAAFDAGIRSCKSGNIEPCEEPFEI